MGTTVTKQKIFDHFYLLWDIQGWACTSQKFHVLRSRELWDNRGAGQSPPPPPLGIRCGSKTNKSNRNFVQMKKNISTLEKTKKIRGYGAQFPRTGIYVNHTLTLLKNLEHVINWEISLISHFVVPWIT